MVATGVRSFLRRLLPEPIVVWCIRMEQAIVRRHFSARSARATFREIYRRNLWGGALGEFYSGDGTEDYAVSPYLRAVNAFVDATGVRSIVDVGCGDFRVGAGLARPGIEYVGVDIVPELVARNRERFARPGVRFECVDAIEASPPAGELCTIRHVLQHLSNAEIVRVLDHCRGFRYLVVTEDRPAAGCTHPNRDKPHGPDIRVWDGSAVCVELPPFSRPILQVLCEVPHHRRPALIRTVVIAQPS